MPYVCISCYEEVSPDEVRIGDDGPLCLECYDKRACDYCGLLIDGEMPVYERGRKRQWQYHLKCLEEANKRDAEIKEARKHATHGS